MATSNQDATQAEELQKMLGTVSQIKTKPDADLPFLIQLETTILAKLREPFAQNQQQAYGAQAQPGAPTGPPLMPGPGGIGVGSTPGQGVPGVMSMPSLPPVGELARMLSDKSGRK